MLSLGRRLPAAPQLHLQAGQQLQRLRHQAGLRAYHCQTGVHGYRPRREEPFQLERKNTEARVKQSNFYRLVEAFRTHGHKVAGTNPYRLSEPAAVPELDVSRYGLRPEDAVSPGGILEGSCRTVAEAVESLRAAYCGPISTDLSYLEEEEREWLWARLERVAGEQVAAADARTAAEAMLQSQAFDNFLATKFVSFKRYGCEGAESMLAFFLQLVNSAADGGVEQLVVGMPHRGRLNLLTGPLLMDPSVLFRKLKGLSEFPDSAKASGDVTSHLISSVDLPNSRGGACHVTVLYNPSHLEAVNPVSMGKTRARQQSLGDGDYAAAEPRRWGDKVLNLQIHGDAALPGQGINQETLALSRLPHFEVGGSLHLVVNNQVGFTTPSERASSSRYGTDLARVVGAPVLHVNGTRPEAVMKAARLAVEYQRRFRKDVFVNMNCFRLWGHNEMDDPTFTNPLLYKKVRAGRSVPDTYGSELVDRGVMKKGELEKIVADRMEWLNDKLKKIDSFVPKPTYFQRQWSSVEQAGAAVTSWDTGVDVQLLRHIARKSVEYPEHFNVHPHLKKIHVDARLRRAEEGAAIDWATAEAMAFGSLLAQGFDVRITGQDVGRATFSHRHAMLVDQETNDIFIPLNSMEEQQKAHLEVVNSPLSEEAVLGFEYGFSIENPNRLVIWEAQFGDFFNGAQIIIDTFITSGETKWMQCSGLTMLLPHGYDGMGPEHSSCRLERFLQLTDSSEVRPDGEDVNFQVANPTTSAQYFHLLRRQVLRKWRKPLVIVAPKIMIRMSEAASSLMDMAPATTFKPVIGDTSVDPLRVERVLLVSGKHFHALDNQRRQLGRKDVAIVRLEELCPFPVHQLNQELNRFPKAKHFIWSQEEPRNMGAWTFVKPRIENMVGRKVHFTGRDTLAAPAVGIGHIHQQQAKEVIENPFTISM
ncbi:2-oxoadipate dehydrogenase complex component E1 isoform X1 [Frankliniella occidentalis]|uniref:2-oxoadipate dehydrogenase complex component E1 isoform X1 n=2 Tax=Frankliniella occidentalis TaxID=133901 RepID=A0A6J1SFD2_FRAOC|nr:2-oxoadipate dehydrogenase complex component E1 isoform X1 [Frankliniella occidentalis]